MVEQRQFKKKKFSEDTKVVSECVELACEQITSAASEGKE